MSPRHLRHRHAGRSGLPADRALLLGAPVAIPAPTRHRSRQQSVHYLQWAPSPTSAFMIDVEARSARAGRPDAHIQGVSAPIGVQTRCRFTANWAAGSSAPASRHLQLAHPLIAAWLVRSAIGLSRRADGYSRPIIFLTSITVF